MIEPLSASSLFRQIKILCDTADTKGKIYLSGSQQYHLMRGVTESLAGRIHILELPGLSQRELSGDSFSDCFVPTDEYVRNRLKTVRKPKSIWKAIHRGAYPELADPETDWELFYANYLKSYLERDVRDLAAVHNLRTFERFMIAAAARTGEVLNASNIADETGADVTTVKRWLTPDTAERGAMSGHLFETYVLSEIIKSFTNAGKDYRHLLLLRAAHDRRREAGVIPASVHLTPPQIFSRCFLSAMATASVRFAAPIF